MRTHLFIGVFLVVLTACSAGENGQDHASLSGVSVMADPARPTAQIISWTARDPQTPVAIEISTDPDAAPGEGTMIADGIKEGRHVYDLGNRNERVYFTLIPEQGAPVKTALRVLPLEGGRNFRDLGGYQSEDGRTVRWGQVYRSGVMAGLTDADYRYLSGLGIGTVCDFRAVEERAHEPTDWRAGEIDYIAWDYSGAEGDGEAFFAVFQNPDVTPDDIAQMMTGFYHQIAYDHQGRFAVMFDRLAKGDVPLAFNCSAGKDRTGVAAALLLTALGVPRDTVVADYAMTEKVVDFMAEFGLEGGAVSVDENAPYAFLLQLPPEVVQPLMRSDPRYIEAMFKQVEQDHGSVLAYIQTELGVDDDELESIRARLLE